MAHENDVIFTVTIDGNSVDILRKDIFAEEDEGLVTPDAIDAKEVKKAAKQESLCSLSEAEEIIHFYNEALKKQLEEKDYLESELAIANGEVEKAATLGQYVSVIQENLQKSEEQMNQLITNDKEFSQQDTDYKNLITRFNAKLGKIQKKLKEAIHTNQTLEQELADFKEKYNLSQEAVDELRTKLIEKDTVIQNTALEIDTIANQIYNVFEQHGLLNLFATGNDEER